MTDLDTDMATATLIDGKALGRRIKQEAAERVAELAGRNVRVSLDAVLVGDPDAGGRYRVPSAHARSER